MILINVTSQSPSSIPLHVQNLKHYAYMYLSTYNICIYTCTIHIYRTYPYKYGIRIKYSLPSVYRGLPNWKPPTESSLTTWLGWAEPNTSAPKIMIPTSLGSAGFAGTKFPALVQLQFVESPTFTKSLLQFVLQITQINNKIEEQYNKDSTFIDKPAKPMTHSNKIKSNL